MKRSYYLWTVLGVLILILLISIIWWKNNIRQFSIPVSTPSSKSEESQTIPASVGQAVEGTNSRLVQGKIDSIDADKIIVLNNSGQKQEVNYDSTTIFRGYDPYSNKLVAMDVKKLTKNLGVSVGYTNEDSKKLAITVDVSPEFEKTFTIDSLDQATTTFRGKVDDGSKEEVIAVNDKTKYRQPGDNQVDIEGLSWSDLIEGKEVTVDCDYISCFSSGKVNAASIVIWK
jgi:hypothetical protein